MITTICLNPCFDKTVSVDRLQPGQVNRIREARVDLGGKGINVAVVANVTHKGSALNFLANIVKYGLVGVFKVAL